MAGEVNVVGGLGEDIHDVVHRGSHSCPPLGPGASVISSGDIGLRGDPMKIGRPLAISRKAPKGGEDTVDRGILPVSLHKGKLPCDVVDEGDPEGAEAPGKGRT